MKHSIGEPKGRVSRKKTTNQASPVLNCSICPTASAVSRNKPLHGLVLCSRCTAKIREYKNMTQEAVDKRARQVVGNLMCVVIARHGLGAGVKVAKLLNKLLV